MGRGDDVVMAALLRRLRRRGSRGEVGDGHHKRGPPVSGRGRLTGGVSRERGERARAGPLPAGPARLGWVGPVGSVSVFFFLFFSFSFFFSVFLFLTFSIWF